MTYVAFLIAMATTTASGLTIGHLLARRQRRIQAAALVAATELIRRLHDDIDRLSTALTNTRSNAPDPTPPSESP